MFILFYRAPNDDFSPSNLQTVNDSIFLNLFDEVVVDIQQVISALVNREQKVGVVNEKS